MELNGFGYYDFIVNNAAFKTTDFTKTVAFDNDLMRRNAEL